MIGFNFQKIIGIQLKLFTILLYYTFPPKLYSVHRKNAPRLSEVWLGARWDAPNRTSVLSHWTEYYCTWTWILSRTWYVDEYYGVCLPTCGSFTAVFPKIVSQHIFDGSLMDRCSPITYLQGKYLKTQV